MKKGRTTPKVKNDQRVSDLMNPTGSGVPPSGVVEAPMFAAPPKKTDKILRGGTTAGRPGQIVTAANRWRENYNPIRGLTMRRAVELLELGQRGDMAYLQWTYFFIEKRNPTLSGLISRCEAPLADFDWQIKTIAEPPPGMTEDVFKSKAAKQKQALQEAYNYIDNLREAIKHLHLADFRGYAHLQKHRDSDGCVRHLETLYQWCICRDGLAGNWFWNPDSRSTSMPMQFLGSQYCIGGDNLPLEDFIIRECPRPINEIGLVHTVRLALCEKDWDGFIEIYGIPGGVVVMPPNVPQGRESEYEDAARRVAEGAAGALPNGSDYKANDGPRGVDPFTPREACLNEQLILAGTGGKLAMLTEKSSDTRGNSKVHDKSFGEIANGRAKSISECFNQQFDCEILNEQFPGEEHLVYFDFGAEEEEDINALCTNVATLKQAGKDTDTEWLAEKTGYELKDVEPDDTNPSKPGEGDDDPKPGNQSGQRGQKITNRETADTQDIASTIHEMIFPLLQRLQAIQKAIDAEVGMDTVQHMVDKLLKDFPHIANVIESDDSIAKKLSPMLADHFASALQHKPKAHANA